MSDKVSAGRRAAFQALRLYEKGMAADEALASALERVDPDDPRDRALATTLVYGAIRRMGTIDYALSRFIKRPLAKVDPAVLIVLRLAVYQLMWLSRIPDHAVVNEAVEQAKRAAGPRAGGFVNGVLRALLRAGLKVEYPSPDENLVAYLSTAYSHPAWLVERYLSRLGRQETGELLAANNRPPVVSIRVNRLRADKDEVASALAAAGATVTPGLYAPEALHVKAQVPPPRLPGFEDGAFTPQDEGSMLVSHVLDPAPGEKILDACAAPGTKTTHIAERMDDQGEILALDRDAQRLKRVSENASRLRLQSIRAQAADARHGVDVVGQHWADRVLVDAPCTGLGTLARRPDLRWRKKPSDIYALARLQGEILDGVAPVVRPGGVLVYSTCTTEPEENQAVVKAFLSRWPQFRLVPLHELDLLPGGLRQAVDPEGWLQLWPHRHGTNGFFIARLERRLDR